MAMPSVALLSQSVLSGVFIGALYGLLGLGLSLSWGLLRQINLAHFALAVLGAAMQWVFARFKVRAFTALLVTFDRTVTIEGDHQATWSADFRTLDSVY